MEPRRAETGASPVDNAIYDRRAEEWWNEEGVLHVLYTALNPPRCQYFSEVLREHFGEEWEGLRALDVGCGGGLMAAEMASRGLDVTGVDPSLESLRAALDNTGTLARAITVVGAVGERLPVADGAFPVVYCCDVLEHVADLHTVVRELARVLRQGGILFFDTINRTFASWLVTIKLWQDWSLTRFMPTNVHEWEEYIRPDELEELLERNGLTPVELHGITPGVPMASVFWALVLRRLGRITYGEMGRRFQLERSSDLSISYMGYAVKG